MSRIEWTDESWNPVRGCSRVSEGCRNCYAERMAARFALPGMPFAGFASVDTHRPRWTGRVELIPSKLDEPLHWRKPVQEDCGFCGGSGSDPTGADHIVCARCLGKGFTERPRRVFVNSMSDLFHEELSHAEIGRVFAVMASAPQHTFQILTKRPRRMRQWFTEFLRENVGGWMKGNLRQYVPGTSYLGPWPLPNVWLGVSPHDQESADRMVPLLLQTPAARRFVSYEPALGPVDFSRLSTSPPGALPPHDGCWYDALGGRQGRVWGSTGHPRLDWLIVGGESGPGARPCDVAWIRSVVRQCREAGVACFVKQLGARAIDDDGDMHGRYIAGGIKDDSPLLEHPKGGDPSEWPEDLRVREYPK